MMMSDEIVIALYKNLERAQRKHDRVSLFALFEEAGEVAKAIQYESEDRFRQEVIDLMTVCYRLLTEL